MLTKNANQSNLTSLNRADNPRGETDMTIVGKDLFSFLNLDKILTEVPDGQKKKVGSVGKSSRQLFLDSINEQIEKAEEQAKLYTKTVAKTNIPADSKGNPLAPPENPKARSTWWKMINGVFTLSFYFGAHQFIEPRAVQGGFKGVLEALRKVREHAESGALDAEFDVLRNASKDKRLKTREDKAAAKAAAATPPAPAAPPAPEATPPAAPESTEAA